MKNKYIMIILIATVAIAVFLGVTFDIVSPIYDVDDDGDIDTIDVTFVYDQIPTYDVQYDVDEDGDVDMIDVTFVYDNIGNTPGEETNFVVDWVSDVIWN